MAAEGGREVLNPLSSFRSMPTTRIPRRILQSSFRKRSRLLDSELYGSRAALDGCRVEGFNLWALWLRLGFWISPIEMSSLFGSERRQIRLLEIRYCKGSFEGFYKGAVVFRVGVTV